jgi:sugar O-acyltransferase (sialic acid O-acetyltransferase NeuD family)
MKMLCIYGYGGMGREIADLAYRLNLWKEHVFIDDNVVSRIVDGLQVYTFDEIVDKFDKTDLEFIVATGEPSTRQLLYEKLEQNELASVKVMDPGFVLSRFSTVGDGTIIHTGATITCNVHIGKGCLINKHAVIGHDVTVGDYSVISPNVTIGGNVNIGLGCYIGSGAIIRNGINIGDNSIIGMGAVVLKDVETNSVMVGNPARFIRENTDKKVFK